MELSRRDVLKVGAAGAIVGMLPVSMAQAEARSPVPEAVSSDIAFRDHVLVLVTLTLKNRVYGHDGRSLGRANVMSIPISGDVLRDPSFPINKWLAGKVASTLPLLRTLTFRADGPQVESLSMRVLHEFYRDKDGRRATPQQIARIRASAVFSEPAIAGALEPLRLPPAQTSAFCPACGRVVWRDQRICPYCDERIMLNLTMPDFGTKWTPDTWSWRPNMLRLAQG